MRSDIRRWREDPLLLAWPWAVSSDYHTIPGSIDQIDKTALAISTKFVLEFVRGLQTYAPQDLREAEEVELPVDEGMVQMLRERGGVKSESPSRD
ncbi:MAG: hypothetical protein AB1640_11870 [bacterium]